MIAEICIVAACLYIGYVVWLYPYLIMIIIKLQRKSSPVALGNTSFPSVTVIVPCYNESPIVAEKMSNVFLTDYPLDHLQVIAVDNASLDDTLAILQALTDKYPMQALQSPRSKVKALNAALKMATGHIIVSTDCDTRWEADTLRRLLVGFKDPSIGAVCATPKISGAINKGKEAYHQADWRIRALESTLDSCCSLDGRLMAFRRDLFDFFPDDTVIDDFDLTLLLLRKGFRSIILEDVFIYEPCMQTVKFEFMQIRRRIYTAILSMHKYRSDLFSTQMGFYGWVIYPPGGFFLCLSRLPYSLF